MRSDFTIKLNKEAICYFYLSNLALEGKKFWVRQNYNEHFLSSVGSLTTNENNSLKIFSRTIFSLEEKNPSLSMLEIFCGPSPWAVLKKLISAQDYKSIQLAFDSLKLKWSNFWENELSPFVLEIRKNLAQNIADHQKQIETIFCQLSLLYGAFSLPKKIPIFIVPLSQKVRGRGGKYLSKNKGIILEISPRGALELRTIEVILHEITHLFFENEQFFQYIKKFEKEIPLAQKNALIKLFEVPSIKFCIKEIIATAITMRPTKAQYSKPYSCLLQSASRELKPLILHYVKNKMLIDQEFIKKVFQFWFEQAEKEKRLGTYHKRRATNIVSNHL